MNNIQGNKLLFKTLVGSQAYGTAIPTSDRDYKGVYIQHNDAILGFNYKEQIDVTKDECYYEIRRYLQLLQSANPTVLEMLFVPDDCVEYKDLSWQILIDNRHLFLTKQCKNSFGGFAVAQIKRAKGLNKKMNWEEKRVERKEIMDFIWVVKEGKSILIRAFLSDNVIKQEYCALAAIDHFPGAYALYWDGLDEYDHKGICGPDSNDVRLSSIPKDQEAIATIFFNKDAYSISCKEYREYQEWLSKRNVDRYVDVENHGQKIDSKNLLHCRRLIDTAIEIATEGTLNVRRPNADYLLSIRRGEVSLEDIIQKAEEDILYLDALYADCDLPDKVDMGVVNDLLLQIRHYNG